MLNTLEAAEKTGFTPIELLAFLWVFSVHSQTASGRDELEKEWGGCPVVRSADGSVIDLSELANVLRCINAIHDDRKETDALFVYFLFTTIDWSASKSDDEALVKMRVFKTVAVREDEKDEVVLSKGEQR